MYTTAKIESKAKQLDRQKNIVTAVFVDDAGQPDVTHQFSFSLDTSFEDMQRAMKGFAANLNKAGAESDKIEINTVLDLSTITEPVVAAEDDEYNKWSRQYGKLNTVQHLITLGVLTGTEPFVLTLRQKVKDDFKPAFLKLM